MNDKSPWSPFVVFEHEGRHTLMLSDNHMVSVMDVFEANGRYGNGYGFTDMTLGLIRQQMPELEDEISFDPEAGTFAATCDDKEGIERLARALHRALHDADELGRLVAAAPWEYD